MINSFQREKDAMKRSKKPLTFAAIAAGIGAISLAVEGCVYGPPPETNVYGPPPDRPSVTETASSTRPYKPSESDPEIITGPSIGGNIDGIETDVYGPPPDVPVDNPEQGVYGPPPDDVQVPVDGPEEDVYGPPSDDLFG